MGSGSDLGCCANVVRGILIIINILFVVLGIIVLAIGIWAIVSDQNYSFVTGSAIVSGAAILIVAGIVTIIICVVGILGAIFKARPLLAIYAVAVLLIVILEIVAGILGFVFRNALTGQVNDNFMEALTLYRVSPDQSGYREDVNDFVSFAQSTLKCCGVINASDWLTLNEQAVRDTGGLPACDICDVTDEDCIPFYFPSDLGINVTTAYAQGCGTGSSDLLQTFLYAVGGVGIAFGILEIVGILFALFLCCCITGARRQEVV